MTTSMMVVVERRHPERADGGHAGVPIGIGSTMMSTIISSMLGMVVALMAMMIVVGTTNIMLLATRSV